MTGRAEFTGKGIRFKVTVSGADTGTIPGTLLMEKEEDGGYIGVTAEVQRMVKP